MRLRAPQALIRQTWRTFLDNHLKTMVSVDFLVVPTIRFQILYVFLVLGARAPAHPALCRHRTSHGGMDGAAASKTLMLCRLVVEAPKLAHNIPKHRVAGPACERVSGQL